MNITVINIKDLIRAVLLLAILIITVISLIMVAKGKDEINSTEVSSNTESSSLLYCLDVEIPMMKDEDFDGEIENVSIGNYKILDSQLAMLYSMEDDENYQENVDNTEENETIQTNNNTEEVENKTLDSSEGIETKVINEHNIVASYTDTSDTIQVKNQSKYDITELLANATYELKNKDKVIIYHTHTCESYTSSEKYNYEMTGSYRTTDLNYSVAKVRR